MGAVMSSVRQALSPDALARLSNMELRARVIVEGHYSGQHVSASRGASVEFVDHREYAPGDEPRHIDWRVYGRTDRLYVKQYEAETNLDLHILVDVSRSMDFTSREVTKLRYATFVAAALAYLATRQRDSVGLFLFDHEIRQHLPPMSSAGHLAHIFDILETASSGGKTHIRTVLEEVAARVRRRAIILLLSDLLENPEDVLRGLGYFRHRGHDVIVLQIMDPAELTLNYQGTLAFEDLETSQRLTVEIPYIRGPYLAELRRFLATYRKGCRDRSVDYALLDTGNLFDAALAAYLARRRSHLVRRRQ